MSELWYKPGGKVTCTSWVLNPWCEVQPRVATPWCEVQPRVATTRVGTRCTRCCPVGGRVHATTGLKPELQLHSPPNRVYCPRLHARGSGYFLRAVGPALEASVERWRRTYVIDRPELLLGLLFVRGRPPPIAEEHRAIPLGYDPPANGQSVLAPSFRGRERAEFQPGLQLGHRQTRPINEARLLILTTEGPRRRPQHCER